MASVTSEIFELARSCVNVPKAPCIARMNLHSKAELASPALLFKGLHSLGNRGYSHVGHAHTPHADIPADILYAVLESNSMP